MRKGLLFSVAACLLLIAGAWTWRIVAAQPAATQPAASPAMTVTTQQAQRVPLPVTHAANGSIAAWQEAIIGTELNGIRLAEVLVNVGDSVTRGQVLAVFHDGQIRAQVAQAQAAAAEAQAAVAEAGLAANRARKLKGTGAASQQEIDRWLIAEQSAKARLESARANLAQIRTRESEIRVLAPDDGIISSRAATVGGIASPGSELFRLIRQGRLEWRAELTAEILARLQPGTSATITASNGDSVQGTVRSIAPAIDPRTRMGIAYVDFDHPGDHPGLKAGMFARGAFLLDTTPAWLVDQQAIVMRDGFNHVFLLSSDDRVTQLRVRLGRKTDTRQEVIADSLGPDTRIIVQGAGFLNDGDIVRVAGAYVPPSSGEPQP